MIFKLPPLPKYGIKGNLDNVGLGFFKSQKQINRKFTYKHLVCNSGSITTCFSEISERFTNYWSQWFICLKIINPSMTVFIIPYRNNIFIAALYLKKKQEKQLSPHCKIKTTLCTGFDA